MSRPAADPSVQLRWTLTAPQADEPDRAGLAALGLPPAWAATDRALVLGWVRADQPQAGVPAVVQTVLATACCDLGWLVFPADPPAPVADGTWHAAGAGRATLRLSRPRRLLDRLPPHWCATREPADALGLFDCAAADWTQAAQRGLLCRAQPEGGPAIESLIDSVWRDDAAALVTPLGASPAGPVQALLSPGTDGEFALLLFAQAEDRAQWLLRLAQACRDQRLPAESCTAAAFRQQRWITPATP